MPMHIRHACTLPVFKLSFSLTSCNKCCVIQHALHLPFHSGSYTVKASSTASTFMPPAPPPAPPAPPMTKPPAGT